MYFSNNTIDSEIKYINTNGVSYKINFSINIGNSTLNGHINISDEYPKISPVITIKDKTKTMEFVIPPEKWDTPLPLKRLVDHAAIVFKGGDSDIKLCSGHIVVQKHTLFGLESHKHCECGIKLYSSKGYFNYKTTFHNENEINLTKPNCKRDKPDEGFDVEDNSSKRHKTS